MWRGSSRVDGGWREVGRRGRCFASTWKRGHVFMGMGPTAEPLYVSSPPGAPPGVAGSLLRILPSVDGVREIRMLAWYSSNSSWRVHFVKMFP